MDIVRVRFLPWIMDRGSQDNHSIWSCNYSVWYGVVVSSAWDFFKIYLYFCSLSIVVFLQYIYQTKVALLLQQENQVSLSEKGRLLRFSVQMCLKTKK